MSKQLNIDYGRYGIQVKTLCPGQIITDQTKLENMRRDPTLRARIEIVQPVGRVGLPIGVRRARSCFLPRTNRVSWLALSWWSTAG